MTYAEAMKHPAKSGIGWAHIEHDSPSMQAATADSLSRYLCIRAEAIYDWAIRQDVSLLDSAKQFIDTPDLLLVCVLNNWSIDHAVAEIAKTERED